MTREDIAYILEHICDDIYGFPPALVVDVCQRTVMERCNTDFRRALRDFSQHRTWCFSWSSSPEGDRFWRDVIERRKFDLYFKKFPDANKLLLGVGESMLNLKKWQ